MLSSTLAFGQTNNTKNKKKSARIARMKIATIHPQNLDGERSIRNEKIRAARSTNLPSHWPLSFLSYTM